MRHLFGVDVFAALVAIIIIANAASDGKPNYVGKECREIEALAPSHCKRTEMYG